MSPLVEINHSSRWRDDAVMLMFVHRNIAEINHQSRWRDERILAGHFNHCPTLEEEAVLIAIVIIIIIIFIFMMMAMMMIHNSHPSTMGGKRVIFKRKTMTFCGAAKPSERRSGLVVV